VLLKGEMGGEMGCWRWNRKIAKNDEKCTTLVGCGGNPHGKWSNSMRLFWRDDQAKWVISWDQDRVAFQQNQPFLGGLESHGKIRTGKVTGK